jgi:hypothetical protein
MLTGLHRARATASAAALTAALLLAPSWAGTGAPSPAPEWRQPEPLSAGLASGRVRADDLRGREVFAHDETWLGTFEALRGRAGGAIAGVIALDGRLGLGGGCIAAPLALILEAPERRLVLVFSPDELRKAAEAHLPCRP